MDKYNLLEQQFEQVDESLTSLESALQQDTLPPLSEVLVQVEPLVKQLLHAYGEFRDCDMSDADDLLGSLKAFVKGDPSLNAVRDNVRELVYYQNCLNEQREDALPDKAGRMALRTARHIYLYLHSRMEQERMAV